METTNRVNTYLTKCTSCFYFLLLIDESRAKAKKAAPYLFTAVIRKQPAASLNGHCPLQQVEWKRSTTSKDPEERCDSYLEQCTRENFSHRRTMLFNSRASGKNIKVLELLSMYFGYIQPITFQNSTKYEYKFISNQKQKIFSDGKYSLLLHFHEWTLVGKYVLNVECQYYI